MVASLIELLAFIAPLIVLFVLLEALADALPAAAHRWWVRLSPVSAVRRLEWARRPMTTITEEPVPGESRRGGHGVRAKTMMGRPIRQAA